MKPGLFLALMCMFPALAPAQGLWPHFNHAPLEVIADAYGDATGKKVEIVKGVTAVVSLDVKKEITREEFVSLLEAELKKRNVGFFPLAGKRVVAAWIDPGVSNRLVTTWIDPDFSAGTEGGTNSNSYAARRRQRLKVIEERRRAIRTSGLTPEESNARLQEYQLELIRAGGSNGPPLPIPLTAEMDRQLVEEGVLPPSSEDAENPIWTNRVSATQTNGTNRMPYAERRRQRLATLEERRREMAEMLKLPPAELKKKLQEIQMELIRAKGSNGPPLPIPITREMDDQLVGEGILPPREEVNGATSNAVLRLSVSWPDAALPPAAKQIIKQLESGVPLKIGPSWSPANPLSATNRFVEVHTVSFQAMSDSYSYTVRMDLVEKKYWVVRTGGIAGVMMQYGPFPFPETKPDKAQNVTNALAR